MYAVTVALAGKQTHEVRSRAEGTLPLAPDDEYLRLIIRFEGTEEMQHIVENLS